MYLSSSAPASAFVGACPALLRRLERATAPVSVLAPGGRVDVVVSPVRSDGRVRLASAGWLPVAMLSRA